MTRKEIEDKIKTLTSQDKRTELEQWIRQRCSDFEAQQIINDLDSYNLN